MKQNLFNKIKTLDLEPIIFSLTKKDDGVQWSIKKAKTIEKEYKNFLFLICEYPEKTVIPTKDIDCFWHTHILDTRKYFKDCIDIYGQYIHHFPYLGTRNEQDKKNLESLFRDSQQLYKISFNRKMGNGVESSMCSACSHCGGDTGINGNFGERPVVVY